MRAAWAIGMADEVLGTPNGSFDIQLYALSAVVYAERGDESCCSNAPAAR